MGACLEIRTVRGVDKGRFRVERVGSLVEEMGVQFEKSTESHFQK